MTTPTKTPIRSYRDLTVWQRALELIEEVYRVTERLPKAELHGLCSQMRRSAVSVAANIAEGHSRRAIRDYQRMLSIANGSLRQLETYVEICFGLDYLSRDQWTHGETLSTEVGRMLTGLRGALRRRTEE